MFKCCTQVNSSFDPTDKIKSCKIHGKPILFICLNYDTCLNRALFCTDCSAEHKGHTWETVSNFFTDNIKDILTNKSQNQQQKIETILEKTLDNFQKAKARIQLRLIQIQNAFQQYFGELKEKYPPIVGARFNQDDLIDNEKMSVILQIVRQRQINEWIDDFEEDVGAIIQPTQQYFIDELNDIELLIKNKKWDSEIQRQKNFRSYILKYFPAKQKDDPFYFRFSPSDKDMDIKLANTNLQAIYNDDTYENIKKPVVLTNHRMTEKYNRISLKITNITKSALIFDCSVIGIGVCLPNYARQLNFRNLHKHSHGAYMMSSDGKVYHSKLPQFINSKAGFSFGKGDIVDMWLDYNEKILHFQRKGLLKHQFEMQLALNQKYMRKLQPFVLFQGESGASIQILSTMKGYKEEIEKNNKNSKAQSKILSTKFSCYSTS